MRTILTSLIAIIVVQGWAQPSAETPAKPEQNDQIIETLDSLTRLFYTTRPSTLAVEADAVDEVPVFADSVYAYRLATIPSPIQMVFNEDVRQYIKLYTELRRNSARRMLGLAEYYFPLFEEALDRHGLPLELKYLPIIESALNPNAVSRVGATGLWQFMFTTGKMYGLEINSYIDERRDPVKATDAACRFLKDLYALYGDWSLVLAAYNSGPGNVNKALRRSGGKMDYWEVRDYLPRETRGYVPAFIGAAYAFVYHQDHKLAAELYDIYFQPTDTVHVNGTVELSVVADKLDVPLEALAFLNPALRRHKIPFTGQAYPLILPMDKIMAFEDLRDSILTATQVALTEVKPTSVSEVSVSYQGTEGKPTVPPTVVPKQTYTPTPYVPSTKGKTKLVYTVKSGDNLGYISEWYDVKLTDIQAWNAIRGSRIWVGQKLDIYVADAVVNKYKNIENLSFQQKQTVEGTSTQTESASAQTSSQGGSASAGTRYINYTIKPGDNLWDISKRYPKNSVEDLKRINNISDLGVIKPGYVIKVGI
jgi:membrane-bound lytic murein transglycosylase D